MAPVTKETTTTTPIRQPTLDTTLDTPPLDTSTNQPAKREEPPANGGGSHTE